MDDPERFRVSKYNEFDERARSVIRKWIDSKGFYSLSVEDYGADLKVINPADGTRTRHEIEVRPCWDEELFPYNTVTIPRRKEKLFSQGVDDLFFWSVNKDYNTAMYVCASVVSKCPIIRKGTDRGEGDFF